MIDRLLIDRLISLSLKYVIAMLFQSHTFSHPSMLDLYVLNCAILLSNQIPLCSQF